MRSIGILGGTFDPIHHGHLRLALEACEKLGLDQVRLVPLNIPPHRSKPVASADHRVAMIKLAITDQPRLCIDECELERNDVSYTIETVRSLRRDHETTPLCLIVGHDAFNKIDTWHQWESLLDYVHIIVANRPGESIDDAPEQVLEWTQKHFTKNLSDINNKPNGFIYFIEIPMLDISSSQIREILKNNQSVDELLPLNTLSYIKSHNLYQDTA